MVAIHIQVPHMVVLLGRQRLREEVSTLVIRVYPFEVYDTFFDVFSQFVDSDVDVFGPGFRFAV